MRNYSDQFMDWLVEEGYTHCFLLAGGNIMHLINSARERFRCVPVVNEVAAGIATEYFNALHEREKAFALVTAGPGVTNIVTAMAGAYLESRELLVVAGQVKSEDLASSNLRQRGIQEVDSSALVDSICAEVIQIRSPISQQRVMDAIRRGSASRKAPVFVDFCLDAQAANPVVELRTHVMQSSPKPLIKSEDIVEVSELLSDSKRPVLLIGGGVSRACMARHKSAIHELGVPLQTTWNAIDRIDYEDFLNFGRPDTWGMRWSNLLLQQADLVIAVGARLSLQQTGFNWKEFAPIGKVVHVDLDQAELNKPHPHKDLTIHGSADEFFDKLFSSSIRAKAWGEWIQFGRMVQTSLPLNDPNNSTAQGFVSPFEFSEKLSDVLVSSDVIIPCSSGGASTVLMQSFRQKYGQQIMNNKALASMGYGLSGAIGASYANRGKRVILVEGDGGFAQNLQELGTVAAGNLPVKIFIFANDGYASIRMTQRNYFDGAWVGCDRGTGVGLPRLASLAEAYNLAYARIDDETQLATQIRDLIDRPGPLLVEVRVDPEQTYFPKITSRVTASGSMESNPLHRMSPDLPTDLQDKVGRYLLREGST